MSLLRGGSLDDRRRRLLAEEVKSGQGSVVESRGSTAAEAEPPVSARRPATSPSRESAYMDGSLRLTDVVPRKWHTYALLMLLGLGIVAGLEALYHYMPLWSAATTDGRIAAFDLDGEGSLAVWFSSTTLSAAGLVALLVYAVRRHKSDDFHGHYRIWLWASATWFLMSLDECGSLHEGFKELMTFYTGQRLMGDGSLWWVGAYGLLLGGVGLRLVIDMRACWSSTGAFLMAGVCYVVAVVTQLEFILPQSGALGVMLEEGCEMVGNLFLLLAMGLHARYVILDAEGSLNAKATRSSRKAKSDDAGTSKRSDLKSGSAPLAGRGALRVDDEESALARGKLSKADRKALRRQELDRRTVRD